MASFNYLHKYKLHFERYDESKRNNEDLIVQNNTIYVSLPDEHLGIVEKTSLVIDNLHMDANISINTTTSSSDNNKAVIKLYNLSDNTKELLSSVNGKIVLEAGFEQGDFGVIFSGSVYDVYTIKEGPDKVTVLSCKDGWTPTSSVRCSLSYPKGTSFTTIFNQIIQGLEDSGIARSSNGILLSEVNPPFLVPSDTVVKKSWSYSGFLRGALDKLCKEFGLTYQIEKSTLYIYPITYPRLISQINVFPESILSIRRYNSNEGKTSNDVTINKGIELKTLLLPLVDTSNQINISKSNNTIVNRVVDGYEGPYKIVQIEHQLSFEGNAWYTMLKCEEVEN